MCKCSFPTMDQERRSKVYKMFGKTPQTVAQDVEIIRNWLENQPHLPEIMEDIKIQNFLVLNKFSIEKTKEKIDMYYTIRSVLFDFYVDCNPKLPNMKKIFETCYVSVHPKLFDGLYRVYWWKAKKSNVLDTLGSSKLWFDIFEVQLYQECVAGDIIVFDMETITLGDMKGFSLSAVTRFWSIYKSVYALRLKNLYLVNSPSYVNIFLTVMKAVVKQKIFERIKVYPGSEGLKEIFDQESLPKDYGGDGPSLEELNEMMQENLALYQERFDELDTLRVDEGLRPEKLDNDEILGFYGNFKKIDVD